MCCGPLARLLVMLGVPYGDKTKKEYTIPVWIKLGTKELKQAFLRILFNFDGSICLRSRREAVEINFVMNKQISYMASGKEFLEDLKELLSEFYIYAGEIHVRHCKDDKYTFMLFISNFESIVNFYRFIGFLSDRKNEKLKIAMKRIYRKARVEPKLIVHVLLALKNKIGSDKKIVNTINLSSGVKYSCRQFEHMRRGESNIPIHLVVCISAILNNWRHITNLPDHLKYLISLNRFDLL